VNKADRAKMVLPALPELLVTLAAQAQLDLKANPVPLVTLAQLALVKNNKIKQNNFGFSFN
jgi:hypothetical protein